MNTGGLQPAISQALRSLEEHVGARLLDRRTRPAALTDAGRILARAVSEGLERIGAGNFAKATLLHVETDEDLSPGWDDYLEATGLPRERQGDLSFGDHVQATQAALAGLGVMLGWIANTADLVREHRLVVFRDQAVIPGGAYYLMSPPQGSNKHGPKDGPGKHGPDKSGEGKPAAALLAAHLQAAHLQAG